MAESQQELDQASQRFAAFERADAKRTEEAKAAKAKAKKLRSKRNKDAAVLQVCIAAVCCCSLVFAGAAACGQHIECAGMWESAEQ